MNNQTQTVSMIIIAVFLGFIALILAGLVLVFFVPVVAYYLWWTYSKTKDLERRLARLEGPPTKDEPPAS